jgi:hypothetical protein
MQCVTCGADNSHRADFCGLCLKPLAATAQAAPSATVAHRVTMSHELHDEHEWWVKRRQARARAAAAGRVDEGTSWAIASRDTQLRASRATWWSAGVFIVFAWIATLQVSTFDLVGLPAASAMRGGVMLQAALIMLVGVAAAGMFSAWIGGPQAWRSTLVAAPFWAILGALACVAAAVGGTLALATVSGIALAVLALTVLAPLRS